MRLAFWSLQRAIDDEAISKPTGGLVKGRQRHPLGPHIPLSATDSVPVEPDFQLLNGVPAIQEERA